MQTKLLNMLSANDYNVLNRLKYRLFKQEVINAVKGL